MTDDTEKYRVLTYRLASALADEAHYSQMPSEDSLTLLVEALKAFPDSEFEKNYHEMKIAELRPVE